MARGGSEDCGATGSQTTIYRTCAAGVAIAQKSNRAGGRIQRGNSTRRGCRDVGNDMTFEELITGSLAAEDVSTEDVLASFLPLLREVLETHRLGLVAPL